MRNILIILVVALITSCSNQTKNKNYLIEGDLVHLEAGCKISMNPNTKSDQKITVISSKEKFVFELNNSIDKGEYTLEIFNPKDSTKQNLYFWYNKQDLLFKGDFNQFKQIKVKNDETNNIAHKYYQVIDNYDRKMSKLLATVKDPDKLNVLVTKYFDSIQNDQKALIFKQSNNPFSLHKIVFLKNKFSSDSLSIVYNKLSDNLKKSTNGKLLRNYLSSKRVEIGKNFIDFKAETIKGNNVKLSDYNGKIILLDFWANWCTWCHVQNKKEFTPLQTKYKDDLVIISYSLDETKEDWQEAIRKDSYKWENLSNLKGLNDPVSYMYKVNLLPHSFLIDKQGKVVKEFIGYEGENKIEAEIQKLLN
ncbi:TlpA disulfide reductase family protein [uncultured Tenacibaculum sp.]|uniref:TlpA family protein disulfide reductase n=1 Tax=uncultured Tenacibaculum sp. TaxID=174713 RepID=UPI002609DC25|nr:TlpA disulfide reductase family protein [uncultured Tenacibaculum sp.]